MHHSLAFLCFDAVFSKNLDSSFISGKIIPKSKRYPTSERLACHWNFYYTNQKGGCHKTTEEVTIVPTELRERVIMVPNSVAQKRIKLPISGRRPMSIIYYAGNLFS